MVSPVGLRSCDPRGTGLGKGFGFIEFERAADGRTAIDKMNGADFGGRTLKVNEARLRE